MHHPTEIERNTSYVLQDKANHMRRARQNEMMTARRLRSVMLARPGMHSLDESIRQHVQWARMYHRIYLAILRIREQHANDHGLTFTRTRYAEDYDE